MKPPSRTWVGEHRGVPRAVVVMASLPKISGTAEALMQAAAAWAAAPALSAAAAVLHRANQALARLDDHRTSTQPACWDAIVPAAAAAAPPPPSP
jgi:hypothetical protein